MRWKRETASTHKHDAHTLTCVSWARAPCAASSAACRGSRCRWGQRAAGRSAGNCLCLGAPRGTCSAHKQKETKGNMTDREERRITRNSLLTRTKTFQFCFRMETTKNIPTALSAASGHALSSHCISRDYNNPMNYHSFLLWRVQLACRRTLVARWRPSSCI